MMSCLHYSLFTPSSFKLGVMSYAITKVFAKESDNAAHFKSSKL